MRMTVLFGGLPNLWPKAECPPLLSRDPPSQGCELSGNCRSRKFRPARVDLGNWVKRLEPLFNDAEGNERRWLEHPKLGEKADVVAVPLTALEKVKLYPYSLEEEEEVIAVGPADAVSVVGFPFGLSSTGKAAIWATGFVASDLDIDFDDLPIFLIDCRSRQGQSGSPVIAMRTGMARMTSGNMKMIGSASRLLGIYSGRINKESDLGRVWKVNCLHAIVCDGT
jgi:hypothetical protein